MTWRHVAGLTDSMMWEGHSVISHYDEAPEWLFDEIRHAGVDYSDPRIAEEYDAHHTRFRDYEKDARLIIERLGLKTHHTVIDLGCGTGAFVLTAAKVCRRVHAVDVSTAMLGLLSNKAQQIGLKNIETHHAGFLTYEHEDEPADAVVSVAALHHLPDFWKAVAFKRMHEMLTPGGKLYLFDVVFAFDIDGYAAELSDWVSVMARSGTPAMAQETVVHIRDEYSTFDWVIEGMLTRAGFSIGEKHSDFPRTIAYICVR